MMQYQRSVIGMALWIALVQILCALIALLILLVYIPYFLLAKDNYFFTFVPESMAKSLSGEISLIRR